MSIEFDYDFGKEEAYIENLPNGSSVFVDGIKYVPERTCEGCAFDEPATHFAYCSGCSRDVLLEDKWVSPKKAVE